jgi:hypothetical protein
MFTARLLAGLNVSFATRIQHCTVKFNLFLATKLTITRRAFVECAHVPFLPARPVLSFKSRHVRPEPESCRALRGNVPREIP